MPIRVLLVDDSAVARGLMNKALSADADILVNGMAANGASAIEQAKEQQPHVIVLDIEMPVMDGLTALPELRNVAPKSHIILLCTPASVQASVHTRALAHGASDYIVRPTSEQSADTAIFYSELIAKIKISAQ